jgi:hypothetical protein
MDRRAARLFSIGRDVVGKACGRQYSSYIWSMAAERQISAAAIHDRMCRRLQIFDRPTARNGRALRESHQQAQRLIHRCRIWEGRRDVGLKKHNVSAGLIGLVMLPASRRYPLAGFVDSYCFRSGELASRALMIRVQPSRSVYRNIRYR